MTIGNILFDNHTQMIGEYIEDGRKYEIALNLTDRDIERDIIWCDMRNCRLATDEEISNASKINTAAFETPSKWNEVDDLDIDLDKIQP